MLPSLLMAETMLECMSRIGGTCEAMPGVNERGTVGKLMESKKDDYRNARQGGKKLVAMEVVHEWRGMDPPGFLLQDKETGKWNDMGYVKAKEKVSSTMQERAREEASLALRENIPSKSSSSSSS